MWLKTVGPVLVISKGRWSTVRNRLAECPVRKTLLQNDTHGTHSVQFNKAKVHQWRIFVLQQLTPTPAFVQYL